MKILRYLIFLSILSGIFFVIYRQSDKTGFHRWWMAFKTAAFIAAILAGLIPASAEAIEPSVNNNQVVHERVIGDREFNSFENNDRQVILAKTGDNAPSVPTSTGRGQPTNFPSGTIGGRRTPHVNPYKTPPKLVDQGLGAAPNPAGAGGGGGAAEFDDNSPVPNKEQSQESKTFDYDYRSNDPKNKKKSKDQCELDENVKAEKIEIVYRIKENPALVREAERAGRDQDAQRSLNNLIEQLSLGNQNPGIGTENVFKDVFELRGKNRARVYYRKVDAKIEILAKSVKSNQQKVINILKKLYD
jgi:hypothetical protein